ncbi:MAG: hypothetical protein KDD56_08195, partial [Bdellovibrionales bacterium]|nr:hypothetical protein [Bdellovibrionales bacterium]
MTLKVWLTQDGEPLPIQDSNRLFRTGLIAKELVEQNVEVDWFASRFSHSNKKNVDILNDIIEIKNNYRIHLLPGVEYKKNFSPFRIIHQQSIARNFSNIA